MKVPAGVLDLSPEERRYLDDLGRITMCVDPDWEPYELMDAQGNFTGIAADLVDIVARRLDIPFVIVPTADWDETLEVSGQGGCMLIPFLNQTPAREQWLTFTEPLFTNPNVFITRNEHDYISDPAELVDRTVVLPHGTSMEEFLRRDYPNLSIITVDDENECYRMVSQGEADMTLRSLTIAAFTIRRDGWFNLKIAGQPSEEHYMNRLRMGVLKYMPELRDILSKAILTITPRERERIVNEHVNIVVETPFDYGRLYRIGGMAVLVLLGIILWNYRLRKLKNSLGKSNEELRQAIEKITESEITHRIIFENSPMGMFYLDASGTIRECNDQFVQYMGSSREKLLDFNPVTQSTPPVREVIRKALGGEHVVYEGSYTSVTGGKTSYMRMICNPVHPETPPTEVIVSVEDITERKELEKQVHFKNALQELVARVATDFINVTAANIDDKINSMLRRCGELTDVDRTFVFKFSKDGQYMSNTHEWCAPGIESVNAAMQNVALADLPANEEIFHQRKMFFVPDVDQMPDGPEKRLLESQKVKTLLCMPIFRKDQILGMFGFEAVRSRRDMSEEQIQLFQILATILGDAMIKKQFEQDLLQARDQADAASQAKSTFLANMSHEIRTPMNAVMGMTQLAMRADPPRKIRGFLDRIDKAARSLLFIINDILDFSKIEAGRLELEKRPFCLKEVMDNLDGIIRVEADQKDISLSTQVDPAVPRFFLGDPLRLGQVLINLAGNAVKFTNEGWVKVSVTPGDLRDEKAVLRFVVEDTGIGMDMRKLPALFDPFWQEDSSVTRRFGGTGLGLPISRQLVEMMGGEIEVDSHPGRGSTFRFSVVLDILSRDSCPDDVQTEVHAKFQPLSGDVPGFAGRRVLLVEDNVMNQELVTELLSGLGIDVEVAVNGLEGAQKAVSEEFDLIFLDIQMPVMDGYEAAREIRRAEGEKLKARTPIIAMTAHSMAGDREKSLEAGMDEHLTKPIDLDRLMDMLLSWIPGDKGQRSDDGGRKTEDKGRRTEGRGWKTEDGGLLEEEIRPKEEKTGLPDSLPPFDIREALDRCNNNPELLKSLFSLFVSEYEDSIARLKSHLDREETREALLLVHSLKGAATTLGAGGLARDALAVEEILKKENMPLEVELVKKLESSLASALEAARGLDG